MNARHAQLRFALLALLAWPAADAEAQRAAPNLARVRDLSELGLSQPPAVRRGSRPTAKAGTRPTILLTGYWPPSNEAVRPFSQDLSKNPGGWMGSDWEGRGYDVVSYFPEFFPADCGGCGIGVGELKVDYQATVADFNAFAAAVQPIAIVTLSRGFFDMSWELEMNQYNRSTWVNDFKAPLQPTPAPPNPNAPAGALEPSQLPVQWIVDSLAEAELGIDPYICVSGDGGGFLSEFIAYLGVWYRANHDTPGTADWCVAAGHVHVGGFVPWNRARAAAEVTLRSLIDYVDAVASPGLCQPDLGSGGPGAATLSVCGDPMASGGTVDLLMDGARPEATGFLAASMANASFPLFGGLAVPSLDQVLLPLNTDPQGRVSFFDLAGGGGPFTLFVQYAWVDPALPLGVGFTNAVAVDYLP